MCKPQTSRLNQTVWVYVQDFTDKLIKLFLNSETNL